MAGQTRVWEEKQTDGRPSLEWKLLDAGREATMPLSSEGQAGSQLLARQDDKAPKRVGQFALSSHGSKQRCLKSH